MVEAWVLGGATTGVGRLVEAFWACLRVFVDSERTSNMMKRQD